jgi:hypothetical protein
VQCWAAWQLRGLAERGLTVDQALIVVERKLGPLVSAGEPARERRAMLAELDDLEHRVEARGWRVPNGLRWAAPDPAQRGAWRRQREARRRAAPTIDVRIRQLHQDVANGAKLDRRHLRDVRVRLLEDRHARAAALPAVAEWSGPSIEERIELELLDAMARYELGFAGPRQGVDMVPGRR